MRPSCRFLFIHLNNRPACMLKLKYGLALQLQKTAVFAKANKKNSK